MRIPEKDELISKCKLLFKLFEIIKVDGPQNAFLNVYGHRWGDKLEFHDFIKYHIFSIFHLILTCKIIFGNDFDMPNS